MMPENEIGSDEKLLLPGISKESRTENEVANPKGKYRKLPAIPGDGLSDDANRSLAPKG